MSASISNSHSIAHASVSAKPLRANKEELEKKDILRAAARKLTQKAEQELSNKEKIQLQRLKNRDQEVKAHEQAHLSAAGTIAVSGARFTYTTGPNGLRYATGGEVSIDTSPVAGDPAATLNKADAIRRAALAPATPSAQDQLVANQASAMAEQARVDLIKQNQQEKLEEKSETTDSEDNLAADEEQSDTEPVINKASPPPIKATNDIGSLINIAV